MKYPVFFEYVCYRLYLWYKGYSDRIPRYSSVNLLSLAQAMNILTIGFLLEFITPGKILINKFSAIILVIALSFLNDFHFKEKNFQTIIMKWENENIKQKKRKGINSYSLYNIKYHFMYWNSRIYRFIS